MLDALSVLTGFRDIPPDGLRRLAEQGHARSFAAGTELMHQGDPGDTIYVVMRGRLQVERSHPQLTRPLLLAEIGPGEVAGEMASLDGGPRSATVTAVEDCEVMELSSATLKETAERYPEVSAALLRLLVRRLRTADDLAEEVSRRTDVS